MNSPREFSIFLAEDDQDDVFFFTDALNRITTTFSLDVSTTGDVLLGKVFAASTMPDLIFLDINMPKKNGLECLELLRKHEKAQDIPIIVLSTSASTTLVEKAQLHGADFYMKKPDDFQDLERLLRLCLRLTTHKESAPPFFLNQILLDEEENL